MTLRCLLDGLLLPASFDDSEGGLRTYDGDESFVLESMEAIYYEVVTATREELLELQRRPYRLLRCADDFRFLGILRA